MPNLFLDTRSREQLTYEMRNKNESPAQALVSNRAVVTLKTCSGPWRIVTDTAVTNEAMLPAPKKGLRYYIKSITLGYNLDADDPTTYLGCYGTIDGATTYLCYLPVKQSTTGAMQFELGVLLDRNSSLTLAFGGGATTGNQYYTVLYMELIDDAP